MDKTKIEWCDSTWNPITGCYHGCPYCYARTIANRFAGGVARHENKSSDGLHDLYQPAMVLRGGKRMAAPFPFAFEPTFHRYRLDDYIRKERPRNIFVCSTADLFGDWIPDEWIEEVFESCRRGAQHRYLFLTKNPQRYNELVSVGGLPERRNFWYGSTRTGVDSEREHESAMTANTFLSVEPLLAPMERGTLNALEMWGWVIVGAETGNRRGKVIPKREWVEEIADTCAESGTPLFMKESLRSLMGDDFRQEYPWEVSNHA